MQEDDERFTVSFGSDPLVFDVQRATAPGQVDELHAVPARIHHCVGLTPLVLTCTRAAVSLP